MTMSIDMSMDYCLKKKNFYCCEHFGFEMLNLLILVICFPNYRAYKTRTQLGLVYSKSIFNVLKSKKKLSHFVE